MGTLRDEIAALPAERSEDDPTATITSDEETRIGAWSLEFDDPVQERSSGDLQPQVVIGQDDRRRVPDTTQFPWSRICCLLLRYDSGARALGTGWLAGPRTVLTAGHNVFQHRFGWAKSVQVIPGWNGGPSTTAPFGVRVSTRCVSVKAWVQDRKGAFDYGAVILPADAAFNGSAIPFAAAPDSALQNAEVAIAGYPTDKNAGTMWFHARRLAQFDPAFLFYDVDTKGGQSGAPLLLRTDAGFVALGVHTDGSSQGNFGVRITPEVAGIFQSWLSPA